jgi:hypothetical protein
MSCTICGANNQTEFPAEVCIHSPDLRDADKLGVFIFPKVQVCLDCGSSSFMTPTSQLAQLRAAIEPLADRGPRIISNS